jgi:N-acetylneuraminic acid mutarotase
MMDAYDPRTRTWTPKAVMPFPLVGHCAEVIGAKVYVLGGSDGKRLSRDVMIYDPELDSWSVQLWSTNRPQAASGCALVNNTVFMAGGVSSGEAVALMQAYQRK